MQEGGGAEILVFPGAQTSRGWTSGQLFPHCQAGY